MKQRIKGKQLKEIAAQEYPEATEESGVVMVSQQLNKPEVIEAMQSMKLKALEDNGITWDHNIKVYKAAQEANKVVILGKGDDAFADVQPDHSVRVRATDSLVKLMDSIKPESEPAQGKTDISPTILKAIKDGNIEELQRVIFKAD